MAFDCGARSVPHLEEVQLTGAAPPVAAKASGVALTCGVAMCTFNGAAHVQQQLASILQQTRLPQAMAIFDDGSTDDTMALLQRWAANAPFPVQVRANPTRLGVVKNFEQAIASLDTDLVFLCDQDDIWLPDKVQRLANEFDASESTTLVFTDARLIDADGKALDASLFQTLEMTANEYAQLTHGNAFDALCRRSLVTGATTAFRRRLMIAAAPFPNHWMHDEWLALIAAAIGQVVCLISPSIEYRQHLSNVIGVARPSRYSNLQKIWWRLRATRSRVFADKFLGRGSALLTRLQRLEADANVTRNGLAKARALVDFARFRTELPSTAWRRIPAVWARRGAYRNFTHDIDEIARDLCNR